VHSAAACVFLRADTSAIESMMGDIMTMTIGNSAKRSQDGFPRNNLKARAKRAFFPALALALGGCSMHPIQQDVTGIPTKQVVDRIRCEAKLAVLDKAINKMRQRADTIISQAPADPPQAAAQASIIAGKLRAFADDLARQGEGDRIDFNPATLPTDAAIRFYNHFINTGIAYDFTFDISEMNNSALAVDPVRLITNGTAGLTVGAGIDLTRSNTRRFQLTDTFGELLKNDQLKCGQRDTVSSNFTYPVAGNIGLHELVSTFVDLSEGQLLQKSPQDGSVFGDTLKFTTNVTGGITPHVEIAAVGNRFGLASPATAHFQATRSDMHTLGISFAMGVEGNVPLLPTPFIAGGLRRVSSVSAPASGSEPNVRRAIDNLAIQRARNLTDVLQNSLQTGTLR
jgi:hypothetical protein